MAAVPQVEARSLSAINYLAAHPPQYPVNPTEQSLEPLVLYISRVPGSRDVILSPFRPQRKNVTGDDVANSLYYVHLTDTSEEQDTRTSSNVRQEQRPAIHRKPLPGETQPPTLQTHASEGDVLRQRLNANASILQENVIPNGEGQAGDELWDMSKPALLPRPTHAATVIGHPPVIRKPLGPRQMGTSHLSQEPEELAQPQPDGPPPQLPPRPSLAGPAQTSPTRSAREGRFSFMSARRKPSLVPFTLSLIRRDPASGQQWNVGRVTSAQMAAGAEELSVGESPTVKPRRQPNISVHLETSGYAKFRGMPSKKDFEAMRPGSASSLPQSFAAAYDDAIGQHDGTAETWRAEPQEGFRRTVAMSYSKSFATNVKDAFRRRPNSRDRDDDRSSLVDLPLPQQPFARHTRQDSGNSVGSLDSGGSSSPLSRASKKRDPEVATTEAGPGLKARGYVFESPWNSRCEFQTGRGGRSLTCRHILPSTSTSYNPLVAQDRRRVGTGRSRQSSLSSMLSHEEASPVSELRFNLPSADLFRKQNSQDTRSSLHGRLDKLLRLDEWQWRGEDWNSSDDEPDEEATAFYMELGREKAGGGNRGKRAKLGKLIVHHQGQKMLDLVVAANMGIWWGAWEKAA